MANALADRVRLGNRIMRAGRSRLERWNFILTLVTVSAMTAGVMVLVLSFD